MKKIIVIFVSIILLLSFAIVSAEYENPNLHGVWIEAENATFIGIKDNFIADSCEYDFQASCNNFLRLTSSSAQNDFVTLSWFIRDYTGIPFKKLWISLANFGDETPELSFSAKNLEGFNNPAEEAKSEIIQTGVKYGNFTWFEFNIPFNLKYAQPTSYKLELHIISEKSFDIGIDALYIGDGTFTPDSKSPPLSLDPYQMADEKLQIFNPSVTTDFSDKIRFDLEDQVKSISTRAPAGVNHPVVVGINGGINLGAVELLNEFPLKNSAGEKLCDVDISIISYMRKRFKQNGSINQDVISPEYLLPGNSVIVKEGRTEYFWLNLDIPADATPGKYSTKLRIKSDEVENIMLPLTVEVLPYKININKFQDSMKVSKLKTVKITDRIIFHSQPHHSFARDKKITDDEAWKRWKADISDISSHGFNGIVFSIPTLTSPIYFPDEKVLGRIAEIAEKHGMKKLFLDITAMTLSCEKVEGKYYLEEFPRELDKAVETIQKSDLTPVLFFDSSILSESQVNNLFEAIDLMKAKPYTSTFKNIFEAENMITRIDYPLYSSSHLDWERENKKMTPGNWIFSPTHHWGHHHNMRALTGIYSLGTGSPFSGLAVYNQPYGNPENDFDLKIGIEEYTPGDMMMTYPSEGYKLYPSLRWECLRIGLVDRALIDLLLDKIKENPNSDASKSALEFLDGIINSSSHKSVTNTFDPNTLDLIRERVIDYILWCDGGEKVVLPSVVRDVVFTIGQKQFVANGEPLEMTVEPIIIEGSTFIPARYLVEPLGGVASWEGETRSVILEALGHHVKLTIGASEATSDGKIITLSKPPTIVNSRTLIPLRAAGTLLGADVSWDGATREATCSFNLGTRPLLREQ